MVPGWESVAFCAARRFPLPLSAVERTFVSPIVIVLAGADCVVSQTRSETISTDKSRKILRTDDLCIWVWVYICDALILFQSGSHCGACALMRRRRDESWIGATAIGPALSHTGFTKRALKPARC